MIKSEMIKLTDVITTCEQNIVSDMGGEKVMLSIRNGNYYNLGTVGGRIWDSLETQITVQQIINLLLSEYEVPQVECEQQVVSFLEHLLKEGLILVNPENSITVNT